MNAAFQTVGILLGIAGGWISGNAESQWVLLGGIILLYFSGLVVGLAAPDTLRNPLGLGGDVGGE